MKIIKVTEKKSGLFLSYQVEDEGVEDFILNIPSLGHGQPERTITVRDPETNEDVVQTLESEFEVEITDVDMSARAKELAIQKEELKINLGIKTKAYLGYMCEVANYTPVEYGQMLADENLYIANILLLNGALETVRDMISAYEPTAYFTAEMRDELVGVLNAHIASV
jgi:hypothetical protein